MIYQSIFILIKRFYFKRNAYVFQMKRMETDRKGILKQVLIRQAAERIQSQLFGYALYIKQMSMQLIFICQILISIITTVSCLTTLSYTFNNSASGIYRYPTYYLGFIQANYTIEFSINCYTDGIDLANTNIQLLKGSSYDLVQQFSCSGDACSGNYYVSSDIGTYYSFRVTLQGAGNLLPNAFVPFHLVVNSYPGQVAYLSSPPNLQNLLRIVDVLRIGVNKYIYIDGSKTVNFTISPIPAELIGPDEALRVVSADSSNDWALDYGHEVILNDLGLKNGIYTYSGQLKTGYYSILITYDVDAAPLKITWGSDPYVCNYTQQYTDYFTVFEGCSLNGAVPSDGFPCLNYEPASMTCKSCAPSYYLSSEGACITNTTCPPRQYFHFGSCYQVNSLCGDYDSFTGACLSCANPNDYNLLNGSCIRKDIICGPRQYQLNNVCYNVSDSCDTFDSNNGNCLSCKNSTYFTILNGSCTEIKFSCPPGQFAVELSCLPIPAECINFDTNSKICMQCIRGYSLQSGTCTKITCAARYYPSISGACTEVSPLCDQYDPISGNCLNCSYAGYSVFNGQCIQVISPLAGCAERQKLGFGVCANASINCQVFNLITGNCAQCFSNYYMDYTGHCSPAAPCDSGQWSINGECLQYPSNCVQIDSLGLCTQCIDSSYRLMLGQCVYFPACASNQYLNSGQQCVDVSPACDQFNPSNGQCITCKIANTSPSQGICCPAGQIYVASQGCVKVTPFQNMQKSPCVLYHPILGNCIKCILGYVPDFQFGGCQQE